jgi:acylglycerol lipase
MAFPVRVNFTFPETYWIPFMRRDGHRLATYRHSTVNPKALVFFFHGWNAHSGDFAETAARFAQAGFECFAMDYLGSGRSQGLHGYTGDFMKDMVMDGVAYIHKVRGLYDSSLPVFIFGLSIGGAVCVNIALIIPELIKGMILLAPALDVAPDFEPFLRKIVRLINWISPYISIKAEEVVVGSRNPLHREHYLQDAVFFKGKVRAGTAVALLNGLEATSNSFESVRTDFIAVQGGCDKVTNAAVVKALVQRSKAKDKDLWFYDEMYHVVTWEPEYPEILERLVSWLDQRTAE